MKRNKFSHKVYQLVRKVPQGKVITYGQIAQGLGRPQAVRVVGNILHGNPFKDVPCHRVVNKEGKLASSFAFGGIKGQRRKLLKEGVRFVDRYQVKLG